MANVNKQEVTMPVRVELNHLTVIDGCYFLNGVLFSGLAYDHRDEKLYKVYQMTEGTVIAELKQGFFQRPGFVGIDYMVIDDFFDPPAQTIYQGKPFTGITYIYQNGFVWQEQVWVDGYIVESITWYPDGSGLIRDYEASQNEYKCEINWKYKQLSKVSITKTASAAEPEQAFSLSINDKNKIESCVISSDDINHFGQLVMRTDLPFPANTLNDLIKSYSLADDLFVNINNDVNFNYFIEYAALNTIKAVSIITNNLSLSSLTLLSNVPNLQGIAFNEDGFSEYQFNNLDASQQEIERQKKDERNHALLALLFSLQAKYHCRIRLKSIAESTLFFNYLYTKTGEGKVIIDATENDFNYLLDVLSGDNVIELELRQKQLPIEILQQLVKFDHLKQLVVQEKDIFEFDLQMLDNNVRQTTQRHCDMRNQTLWHLLEDLQTKLHCDIALTSYSGALFEKKYVS